MKRIIFGSLVAAAAILSNIALAAPPPNVMGQWSVIGNQTPGALVINFQAGAGICRRITGTIYGPNNPIEGFYCPVTGRIHFVRKNVSTNDTTQSWTGNVGDDAATDRMGGTFVVSSSIAGGGVLGEYNFQASRP